MARAKVPIPRSHAKTAYGLISDVAKAILDEPKRANMNCFAETVPINDDAAPACGTVGCFAGWVCLLAGKQKRVADDSTAKDILGRDLDYHNGNSIYVFNSGNGGDIDLNAPIGSLKYARGVVKRIRRFQKNNARKLKARKLSLRAARVRA